MLALDSHQQALFVGIRSTFYRIATIAGQGLLIMLAGRLEIVTDNIPYAWSITFFVLAGLFLGVWIYHKFILPHPDSDHAAKEVSASTLLKEFLALLPVSFRKAGKYCYSLYVTLPFTGSTTGKNVYSFLYRSY